ncbi:MAG: hypothetical protein V1707_01585 [bacterium]
MSIPLEEKDAAALGERLTAFILSLPVAYEEKEQMLEKTSQLNLSEAVEFYHLLEDMYVAGKTTPVDEQYVDDLEKIVQDGDDSLADLDADTSGEIEQLTRQ